MATRLGPGFVAQEYVIYCDESVDRGRYFSNFYGGCLIRSVDLESCLDAVRACKDANDLKGEVKWKKVSSVYLDKYKNLMGEFFEHVAADRIKVRIMFTKNEYVPTDLTPEQRGRKYLLLYYQFLKHAFGLKFSPADCETHVRVYPDKMPDKAERVEEFRNHLLRLNEWSGFRESRVKLRRSDIDEVESHDHDLLQCLDVVLGSIAFRLNDLHKEKPTGQRIRGKRTRAKESLYKFINAQIRAIYPGFNIGITTGGGLRERWEHPYRHWLFVPNRHRRDKSMAKK